MNDRIIPYSYELIETTEDLHSLRPRWEQLFSLLEKPSLFLRWDWLTCWWESFAQSEDQLAIVWVENHGKPFAVVPFFVRRCRYYGLSRRLLQFIGEGNSDRADILVSEPNDAFYESLFSFLQENVIWDVVSLREIPEGSALLAWARSNNKVRFEKDSDCPYISFAPDLTVDVFRSSLSRNLRREFSNMTNRLKKLGDYRFYHLQLNDPDDPVLKRIRSIEQQSAKASRDIYLVFSPDENFLYQQRLIQQLDKSVCPLLTVLELNGEIVSYLYGFIFNQVYHAYNMAFLPEYYRLSPGKLIMQEAIDESIRMELKEFDFLRGNSYIKSKWSKTSRSQVHLTLLRDNFFNRFHGWLIFSVRPYVKSLVSQYKTRLTSMKGK